MSSRKNMWIDDINWNWYWNFEIYDSSMIIIILPIMHLHFLKGKIENIDAR